MKKVKTSSVLTLFGFFTLTASMLMSADEYPAFAQVMACKKEVCLLGYRY